MSDRSVVRDNNGNVVGVDVTTHNANGSSRVEHWSAHDTWASVDGACAEERTGTTENHPNGTSTHYPTKSG